MNESQLRFLKGTFIVLIAFFAGFFFSNARNNSSVVAVGQGSSERVDLAPYWKAWSLLNEKHINADTVTAEDKLWSSIQGLASSFGDPYTSFFPPKESEEFRLEISGNFEGVGMEVAMRDDRITVVSPLKGTPAEEAGIRPGDVILAIDDEITLGMTADDAVSRIRGRRGTPVKLTLVREGVSSAIEVSVVRDTIKIPTIDTSVRDDEVFIISLYNFSGNAKNEFRSAILEFVDSGLDKLIVDVRGNPGGYLDASIEIASYFLPSGKVVVREVGVGKEEMNVFRSKGYDLFADNPIDVVVLVDMGSASASEILAGALREHGVAQLVGTQTFGKGSVQELVEVTGNTTLKVTIAEWLTPEGISISEEGLAPDVVIPYERSEDDYDNQLERAIEILRGN